MADLRSRILSHSKKVEKLEELEAKLAGVFIGNTQELIDKFSKQVKEIIKPAFDEFKASVRDVGRDAVIISNLTHRSEQSIGLMLIDRYLKFGAGKTVKLENPKENISILKRTNTKFYELHRSEDMICIVHRADPRIEPITTLVSYADVTRTFLENELASFFERAYPTRD